MAGLQLCVSLAGAADGAAAAACLVHAVALPVVVLRLGSMVVIPDIAEDGARILRVLDGDASRGEAVLDDE